MCDSLFPLKERICIFWYPKTDVIWCNIVFPACLIVQSTEVRYKQDMKICSQFSQYSPHIFKHSVCLMSLQGHLRQLVFLLDDPDGAQQHCSHHPPRCSESAPKPPRSPRTNSALEVRNNEWKGQKNRLRFKVKPDVSPAETLRLRQLQQDLLYTVI